MNIYRGRTHTEVYLASILYDSIEDQDLSSVTKLLVEKKADPNIVLPRKGISCFHLIIGSDSANFALKVTMLLIQHGGDPNVRSDEGLTPVHIAAAWGRLEILDLLLRCGGDPELTDNCYKSALHYARDEKWPDAVNLIQNFIDYQRLSVFASFAGKNTFELTLDKILVNNGNVIGEYELLKTEKSITTAYQPNLNELPETKSSDYVLNWCNSQNLQTADCSDFNDPIIDSLDSDRSPQLSQESEKRSSSNVTRRKRHESITINHPTNDYISKDICYHRQSSRESGILTLESDGDFENNVFKRFDTYIIESDSKKESDRNKDASSDYCTCTEGSVDLNLHEKNIFEASTNIRQSNSSDASFVTVSEIYKYTDEEEGVVLFEKRILRPSSACSGNESIITRLSQISLPETFNYDSETLRKELTVQGFDPGPITKTTKKVYLKKLYQLKKHPEITSVVKDTKNVYSPELQKTLRNPKTFMDLSPYVPLEEAIKNQFNSPDPTRRWREGTTKASFTYLLLDPRITQNLPNRCEQLDKNELWETFLSAIFYVGKGKRSRPYAHLYSAVSHYNKNKQKTDSEKLQRILDIWRDNHGVICLHLFQNTIPVEAYTREAAMIAALNIGNVTNIKSGDFYGIAATWTLQQKTKLGAYLLHKAMQIFLQEGERQLFPNDID